MKISHSWTFDTQDTAEDFDSHVREQLPWYSMVTGAVATIVRAYLRNRGTVYDIGASTGNVGRSIADVLEARSGELIAIESSKHMAQKYNGPGKLVVSDACDIECFAPFDVAVCFLSLMFMEPSRRKVVIDKLSGSRKPDGCIVVVDKFFSDQHDLASVARHITLRAKVASGASLEDVAKKELSLLGVQVPLAVSELPSNRYEFFRFGEFAGYVIAGESQ